MPFVRKDRLAELEAWESYGRTLSRVVAASGIEFLDIIGCGHVEVRVPAIHRHLTSGYPMHSGPRCEQHKRRAETEIAADYGQKFAELGIGLSVIRPGGERVALNAPAEVPSRG